jgi:RNA polymerase sigma factor (sigma-70 family)
MAGSLDSALGRLRTLAAVRTLGSLSDRDLLARFVGEHDEAAFTVLIERHGPMVLGVCRRALPNRHDAEDACQATFLVLARQADSLRRQASLGSWLHGVAFRVATALKRDAVRRKNREQRVDSRVPADPSAEVSWREVQAVLDEELHRLPERYRAPLVLCYLECLTRDEAAGRLGLTPGGLHGRLERGRKLLRERLTRRGLTLSAVLGAAGLGETIAHAAPAHLIVVASTRAAQLLVAGQPLKEGVVSTHVLALTREVLKSMFIAKLKLGAVAVLSVVLLAVGGGSFASLGFAQDAGVGSVPVRKVPIKSESDEEFIRRLSADLRGTEPTPAEIHFFVASKDAGKRQTLIDLFIRERQAKQQADRMGPLEESRLYKKVREQLDRIRIDKSDSLDRKAKPGQPDLPPPSGEVNGVVEKINKDDPTMISISIGSDAGLAKNQTLDVYRLRPAPQYLGKIRILDVAPAGAVAQRIGNPGKRTPLKVGDLVTSGLTAPARQDE